MTIRPIITSVGGAPIEITGPRHINASAPAVGGANGDARGGDISADGRYVVFVSGASNLVAGDTNGTFDIFRRDLWTGRTELVSSTAAGVIGNGPSGVLDDWPYLSQPSISEDGRYVGFVSDAGNLPGARAGYSSGYVKDMLTGKVFNLTVKLAANPTGPLIELRDANMVIMGRGAEAYLGHSALMTLQVTPQQTFIGVQDRGWITNGDLLGNQPTYTNFGLPMIRPPTDFIRAAPTDMSLFAHPDSLYVSAWSLPTTKVMMQDWANIASVGDTNNLGDIFVLRPGVAGVEIISRQLSGPGGGAPEQSNQASFPGWMSLDGRYITFFSSAANIEAGATGISPGGFTITSATTVWVYDSGNAENATARAQNRALDFSFTLNNATRFTIDWGDGTGLAGQARDGDSFSLDRIYAATGTYDITLRAFGPGGVSGEITKARLMPATGSATIDGWNGRDIVLAGDSADAIRVAGGHDMVHAGGGADTILGGAGADTVFGGAGNDLFRDGPGIAFPDLYVGGEGINTVDYRGVAQEMRITLTGSAPRFGATDAGRATVYDVTGPVDDELYDIRIVLAGVGPAWITGTDLADTLVGAVGGVVLEGMGGADSLVGGRGADYLDGGVGSDTLTGGMGNDTLTDGEGDNLAMGGAGNDTFVSGLGNDSFAGEAGDDQFIARGGADSFEGGAGRNTLMLDAGLLGDDTIIWQVDLGAGLATTSSGGHSVAFSGVTAVGGTFGLDATGTAANETFFLTDRPSSFVGNGGQDRLSAALIRGVIIDGDAGTAESASSMEGPRISTFTGIADFQGSSVADTISGTAARNRIEGGGGDDLLIAGPGGDFLTGGAGADIFAFPTTGTGLARLMDFDLAAGDRADFRGLLALPPGESWATMVAGGYAQLTPGWGGMVLSVDPDGGGDGFVQIALFAARSAADLGDTFVL